MKKQTLEQEIEKLKKELLELPSEEDSRLEIEAMELAAAKKKDLKKIEFKKKGRLFLRGYHCNNNKHLTLKIGEKTRSFDVLEAKEMIEFFKGFVDRKEKENAK